MFADGIRVSGLEVLAKHRIEEGLPLCVALIEPARWGLKNRIKRCMAALRLYGGAARSELPRLRKLPAELAAKRWKPADIEKLGVTDLNGEIETAERGPRLRALK